MNTIKKINKTINLSLANFVEADINFRKGILTKVGKRCQQSDNQFWRDFGDGIFVGMPEGEAVGRCTPAFYRKYQDCTIPSIWVVRDLLAEMPESVRNQTSTVEFLEAAVNR